MSSQPLPNPYTPNTYNPSAWASTTAGDALTKEQADLLYLQFPFAQGLESMVGMTNIGSLTQNGASQFGTVSSSAGIPVCVADYSGITPTDATTKIPTTAWVQTAIGASSGGGSVIFDTDNTWTNDNTFEAIIHGTAPSATVSGTQIPTTEWVNDAITTAISNITPSTNTTFSNSFDGTAISYTHNVPADAQYFNFSGCGCGGRAGANAIYNIDTGGSSIPIPNNDTVQPYNNPNDFQLWAGGQGGGGLGNSISNIPNSSVGLAGQTITFTCSGNGGNLNYTYVEATWTNSITGLPITIRLPNGCNGGDASSVNPSGNGAGGAGVGGLIANAILPSLVGGSWITWTPPNNSAPAGSAGSNSETSFFIYLQPNAGDTPYQVLQTPYDPTTNANGAPWLGGAYPTAPVSGSGTTGYGQYLSSFYTPADIIYYSQPDNYYGNDASPIGQGFFTLNCFTASPSALGGTNASFIAYDDPDPATKTKQIYTDKEGLVVSQDLTTSYKTTTLTPTNLTQDLNTVVSTALIADIITIANAGTPDLDAVLTAGNSAGSNNINMNTNNINNSGTITATSFVGALTGNASSATDATNVGVSTILTGVYYPTVVNNTTGNLPVGAKSNLTYNATTSTLSSTTFSGALTGTATNATNVAITSDNTAGTYYIPFAKTSGTGNKPLFIDDATGPLSYNPSTSTLSASIFTGSANITNAVNNYTFVATTLTLDFGTLTFKNFYNSTAITSAITQSAISFSNAVAGGSYMVYITTGVGGSFTFNTGISGVKTTFATAFTIPASSVGVMSIYYINSVYVVGINILT